MCRSPEGDYSFFSPFTQYANEPFAEVNIRKVQSDEFGAPNAGAVQQLEDRSVAAALVRIQRDFNESSHNRLFQASGQSLLFARGKQGASGIALQNTLPAEVGEESPESSQLSS